MIVQYYIVHVFQMEGCVIGKYNNMGFNVTAALAAGRS